MRPVNEPVDNPVDEVLKRQGLAAADLEWSRVSVGHVPPDGAPVGAWTPMQSHRRVLEAVARCLADHAATCESVIDENGAETTHGHLSDARALLAEILR